MRGYTKFPGPHKSATPGPAQLFKNRRGAILRFSGPTNQRRLAPLSFSKIGAGLYYVFGPHQSATSGPAQLFKNRCGAILRFPAPTNQRRLASRSFSKTGAGLHHVFGHHKYNGGLRARWLTEIVATMCAEEARMTISVGRGRFHTLLARVCGARRRFHTLLARVRGTQELRTRNFIE